MNLNLTPEEKRAYDQLLHQADSDNVGVVMGEVAVKFFEKTRLNSTVLGEVSAVGNTNGKARHDLLAWQLTQPYITDLADSGPGKLGLPHTDRLPYSLTTHRPCTGRTPPNARTSSPARATATVLRGHRAGHAGHASHAAPSTSSARRDACFSTSPGNRRRPGANSTSTPNSRESRAVHGTL